MTGIVYKPYDELLEAVQKGILKDSSEKRQKAAAGVEWVEQTIGGGKGLEFVEWHSEAAQGLFKHVWQGGTSTATVFPNKGAGSMTPLPSPVGGGAGGSPAGAAHPIAAAAAPGAPAPGAPAPGAPAPGAPAPGAPAPGAPAPGAPDPGARAPGAPAPGALAP